MNVFRAVPAFVFLSAAVASMRAFAADAPPPSPDALAAQHEFAPAPAPAWVQMRELGAEQPELKGYRAPAGVKVEVVASEPNVINPVGMRFDIDGSLLLLQWRVGKKSGGEDVTLTFRDGSTRPGHIWVKDVPDDLVRLRDTDGDGRFDTSEKVMDDLRLPSSLLVDGEGWHYFTTRGSVIRRKRAAPGGPFSVEERIVHGLAAYNQHQASGLTLSPDGWLFVTSGDDNSAAEGSDGARVDLFRTGAVWRMRPDGTQLSLFARGFRNPYRDVVLDSFGNIFHVDNDNEDGSKFQGCRIVHVQEDADYGWRLRPSVRCCWPDSDRGSVNGERPGRMPVLAKTGRGAPSGLLLYEGPGFPAFFRGLLIYPDVFRKSVRAYRIERNGATFKIVEQFELLTSTQDGLFRPCQALCGPDGAIYLCDWRTDSAGAAAAWGNGKTGRIWRLTWQGTPDAPAIPRGNLDAWQRVDSGDAAGAWRALESDDRELRFRAIDRLVRDGAAMSEGLLALATNAVKPPHVRAAALAGVCRVWSAEVQAKLAQILQKDADPEVRRLAAESLGRNVAPRDMNDALAAALVAALKDSHPAVRRASALAYGKLVSGWPENDPRRLEATTRLIGELTGDSRADRFLHDGLLRALERVGAPGFRGLAALVDSGAPESREFAVAELESLRSPEAGPVLDAALEKSARLSESQRVRLLLSYRNIQTDPPVDLSKLAAWIEARPTASTAEQIAALETIALASASSPARTLPLIQRMLAHAEARVRRAALKAIADQGVLEAVPALVAQLKDATRSVEERRGILAALGGLRGRKRWSQVGERPGVEAFVDDLAALASGTPAAAEEEELRNDALRLLGQIDFKRAKPMAEALLAMPAGATLVPAGKAALASSVLATDPGGAKLLAERFLAGSLPPELLPQVAAALQRHAADKGKGQELLELRAEVLTRGLLKVTDAAKLEELVKTKGDAGRGRKVFEDRARSQCLNCHRLNGVGAQIGPDLTGLYQTYTVSKWAESILEPSKEIKEGFEQVVATMNNGQIQAGLRVSSDAQKLVLRDSTGREITLPAGDVKKVIASKQSVMPEGLAAALTLDEFVDLLAFLKDGKAQSAITEPPQKP